MASSVEVSLAQYANIIDEIKQRIIAIEHVRTGQAGLHPQLSKEFCFLQLRLICELIALCCLTAHGDLGRVELGDLKKQYSADKIIQKLGALKPDFYPIPYTQIQQAPNAFHITDSKFQHLTKADLLLLYGRCGEVVHRGSIKRLTSKKISEHTQLPVVAEWINKIVALLGQHRISLLHQQAQLLCYLNDAKDGRVKVVIVEATKESEQP